VGVLTRDEIEYADADDQAPAYAEGVTIKDACEREMTARVIRKGHIIE
jgi:hypothetical protein